MRKGKTKNRILADALQKLNKEEREAVYIEMKKKLLERHYGIDKIEVITSYKGIDKKLVVARRGKLPLKVDFTRMGRNPDKVTVLSMYDRHKNFFSMFCYRNRPNHFYILVNQKPVFELQSDDWRKLFRALNRLRHLFGLIPPYRAKLGDKNWK